VNKIPSQPSLSTSKAFVVQFRSNTNVQQGRFEGRVEHVASGEAIHFHSQEELLAFILRLLTDVPSGALGDS
jgi:hypothetical protein